MSQGKFDRDEKFKADFHSVRSKLFISQSILTLGETINLLLKMSDEIDCKSIFQPMQNWESVKLELTAMKYGIENWGQVKDRIIEAKIIKQVDLIRDSGLDKEKITLFLYRIHQFGLIGMTKISNRNAYNYICDRVDGDSIKREWTILWEVPYKKLSDHYVGHEISRP